MSMGWVIDPMAIFMFGGIMIGIFFWAWVTK
jgi:hypothetical protein